MKMRFLAFSILFICTIVIASCKKNDKETCNSAITVTTVKTQAAASATNGAIKVTQPRGAGYQYSINGGTYQADSVFANLGLGTYTITAKNGDCTWTATVEMANPCTGAPIQVNTTKYDAISGQTNGSITVTQPVGTGVTYSINGGAFQASANFNNLAAGTYTVRAKTALGCEGTGTTTLNGYGPKYHAVKQLVLGYCGPCHLNGANSGATTLDTDMQIVAKAARIKARSVDMLPSVMPQSGPLTAIDKQKITDWIAAGGNTNN